MKRLSRVSLPLLLLAIGLAVRAWLVNGDVESAEDLVAIPRVRADFDPVLARIQRLVPAHEKKRPIQPGDWLEKSLLKFCEQAGLDRDADVFRNEVNLLESEPYSRGSITVKAARRNSEKEAP